MLTSNVQQEAVAERTVKLCQKEAKVVNFHYRGGLFIKGQKYDFFRIPTVTIQRDFINNYADVLTLEVYMGTTTFYKHVLPNLDNLQGWLEKRQMYENSSFFVRGGIQTLKRYRAFIHNPPTQGLGAGQTNQIQDTDQSLTKFVVQFIAQEDLDSRNYMWAGLLEMTNPMEALRMILDGSGKTCGTVGIHHTEPDVKDKRQILVPRGTYVRDVAQYLQKHYGIYNHGIGTYMFDFENKGRFWFIYPIFNNNRYDKEFFKLNIFVVPERFDPKGVPRTYYINQGKLVFYTTTKTTMLQNKPVDQLNHGTGIQVVNTEENRGPNVQEVGPNKQKLDGSVGMTSFNLIERKDGIKNYVQVHADTTNMAALRSSIIGNEGQYVTINWQFANPDLIIPGMPVKINYLDGELKTLYGTVHEYHAISVMQGNTALEMPYNCTVALRIYVTPDAQTAL